MSKEINLLPTSSQNFFQKEQTIRVARLIGFGSFVIVITSSLLLFFLGLNTDIPKLHLQQTALENNINAQHNKELQYFYLQDRVSRIQNLLSKRQDFSEVLVKIQTLIPSSVSIESLNVDAKTISLVVSSDSLASMGQFIDGVSKSVKTKVLLKHVTFDNVIANPVKGTYTLSMQGELL